MKAKMKIAIFMGIELVGGIILGAGINKICLVNKLDKYRSKALIDMNSAVSYDKNNPDDVARIRAMTTDEFIDKSNEFYEAYGRCNAAEDFLKLL